MKGRLIRIGEHFFYDKRSLDDGFCDFDGKYISIFNFPKLLTDYARFNSKEDALEELDYINESNHIGEI